MPRRLRQQRTFLLWLCASLGYLLIPLHAQAALPPVIYEITIQKAKIKPTKSNGHAWDFGIGKSRLPDVFLTLEARGQRLQTEVQNNTLTPYWQQKQIFALRDNDYVHIQLYDKDVHRMELIGETNLQISQLSASTELSFGQVESLSLHIVRLTIPKRTPLNPPKIPPKPRGKMLLPPEIEPTPTRSKPPVSPKLRPVPPPEPPALFLRELPFPVEAKGTVRYRHIQAKLSIHDASQTLFFSTPGELQAFSLAPMKPLWSLRSKDLMISNLLAPASSAYLWVGLAGGTLQQPDLSETRLPSALRLYSLAHPPSTLKQLHPFFGDTFTLAWNEKTQQIAWTDIKGRLYLASTHAKPPLLLTQLPEVPLSLTFSSDGRSLWWSGYNHPPQTIEIASPKQQQKPHEVLTKHTSALGLIAHKELLAWCTMEGHVTWYNPSHPSHLSDKDFDKVPCVRLFPHPAQDAWIILYPTKLILARSPSDQPTTAKETQEVTFPNDPALDATLSSKSQTLFTLHQSGKIRRWSLQAPAPPSPPKPSPTPNAPTSGTKQ
ncbi:MAG: hypothetical protein H6728_11940 [Myxococcales bacterium]|nr:hypothetical protein [Myxococcales bacterium]